MKKTILTVLILVAGILSAMAQAPEGVNYQGTVRDASGDLMANESISVIFEVRETSEAGAAVYTETQTLTTNAYGGFAAIIGQGTVDAGDFSTIDWANDMFFLNVNVNGSDLGTSQLQSVPYALNAKTAENVVDPLWERESANAISTENNVTIESGRESLNVHGDNLINPSVFISTKLVNFSVDDLTQGQDILKIEAGAASVDNSQFIDCRQDGASRFRVDVDGSVSASKINRPQTAGANLVPIAYGSVAANGTVSIDASTNNFTVTKTDDGIYNIAINGETLNYTDYSISVSSRATLAPISANYLIGTGANAGKLVTWLRLTTNGAFVDNGFSFLIYKPY